MTSTFLRSTSVIIIVLALFSSTKLQAESYTFTNKDGKELTAEVLGIASGKVSVKNENGKFQIPVTSLTEKDITFLKAWLQRNPNYSVRVSIFPQKGKPQLTGSLRLSDRNSGGERTRVDATGKRSNAGVTTSVENEHFLISLTNDSSVTLKNAKIDYRVFIQETYNPGFGKPKIRMKKESGTIPLSDIGIKQTLKVASETIVLENKVSATKLTTTTEYTDGTSETESKMRKNRTRPENQGIWLKVIVDGKVIKEVKQLKGKYQSDPSLSF